MRCFLLGLGLGSGCGYTTRPLIGNEFRTIHVEIVGNLTFRRDLEFVLTQDIQDEILSRTNLRLADAERADVRLKGEILDFSEHVLATDRNDRVFESLVEVTVRFRFIDQRTGREMRKVTLRDSSTFIAVSGRTPAAATARTFSDLAEHVVYEMEEAL